MKCPNFDSYLNVCVCECYESCNECLRYKLLTTIDTRISDRDLISLFLPFYAQYIHSTSHTILEIRLGNLPYEFNELLNDSDDFEHGHW